MRESISTTPSSPSLLPQPPASDFPTLRLTGLLQIDGGIVDQDAANVAEYGDIPDNLGFRRARLGADGSFSEDFSYRLVVDFATSGRPSFRDAFVEYRGLEELGILRFGEWRQPFGLDSQTPNTSLLFLERALPHAFSPHRQVGLGFRNRNAAETMTWHASIFGYPTDTWGNAVGESGFATATRITAVVWEDQVHSALIHVGVDHSYQHPGESGLRYASRPEFQGIMTGSSGNVRSIPNFVNTGVLEGAIANVFDLELIAVRGPFSVKGEAVCSVIDSSTIDQAAVHGATIQAGYVLTGETHTYNREFAFLERLKPDCPVGEGGIGAWEVGARLSALDLNDGAVQGGQIYDMTLGLTWSMRENVRFQFNYIRSYPDFQPVGKSQADLYATRFSIDF